MGADKALVVGTFIIGGHKIEAVLDTGATGSFVAQDGVTARNLFFEQSYREIPIRTADKRSLIANQVTYTMIQPYEAPDIKAEVKLIGIPNRIGIMGREVVLGLDALKTLNISFRTNESQMVAYINNTEIGKEVKMLQHGLYAMICEAPKTRFDQLVNEYSDIFAEIAKTFIKTEPMSVPLAVDFSKKAKLRPNSIEDVLEINRQVSKMVENDIVEPSESSFSANVLLVPKKNGTKRLVVDFRFLNSIAIKDHYPLPQISEMFLALHDSKHFAALDCTEGFLQIQVLPEHRHRTAFVTSFGSFHYKRCPFGFTNSPAKYQRTMNEIFSEGLFKKCVIYIDDILVFGKTQDELLDNLTWVFEKCRDRNVKLKLSKCKIDRTEVEFLGFKITHNLVCPVPGKYDEIGVKTPTCKKDIRAILGTLNHYARFITNYSDKTKPFRRMTRQSAVIEWTPELDQLLSDLKAELAQAMPMTITDSDSDKKIDIFVSASAIEVTCFDQQNNLIGRAGMALSIAEQKYTIIEQQLTAIVLAYNKFHLFLRGKVTFRTTCKALQNAIKMTQRTDRVTRIMLQLPPDANFDIEVMPGPTPVEQISSSNEDIEEIFYTDGACIGNGTKNCKASWASIAVYNQDLSACGFVEHNPLSNQVAEIYAVLQACKIAKENKFQDIMIVSDSRYVIGALDNWIDVWKSNNWLDNKKKPVRNQDLFKKLAEFKNQLNIKTMHVKGHSTDVYNIKADQLAKDVLTKSLELGAIGADETAINQRNDPEIEMTKSNLELDPNLTNKYEVFEGNLYFLDSELPLNCRRRLFVPLSYRNLLLKISHDDRNFGGHLGIKKTRAKLIGYYWPYMTRDIERYIRTCVTCQMQKAPRKPRYGLLQPIPPSQLFERIHIDIIGPMHESSNQNKYIITVIDSFSRYAFAKAATEVKTVDIIRFLTEEVITKHGCPTYLVSDNGSQFTSYEFKTYMDELGIKHNRTVEYHPQANGLDERFNGTLVKILKNYIQQDQDDWDLRLPWAVMLYNTSIHATTQTSPYITVFGVAPKTPLRAIERESITGVESRGIPAFGYIREFVRQSILKSQEEHKKQYDKLRLPQDFKILDPVLARTHYTPKGLSEKLMPKWDGPYFIYKIITIDNEPRSVILVHEETGKFRRCSFQDLRHLEIRDTKEHSSDELLQQKLPGDSIQDILMRAYPDESRVNSRADASVSSFNDSTTQLSGHGKPDPWVTNTDLSSSSLILPTISHTDTDRSSQWDELIPREWHEARLAAKRNAIANDRETIPDIVTYSCEVRELNTNPDTCDIIIPPNSSQTTHCGSETRSAAQSLAINNPGSLDSNALVPTSDNYNTDDMSNDNRGSNASVVEIVPSTVQSSTPLTTANQLPTHISVETSNELSNIQAPEPQVITIDSQNPITGSSDNLTSQSRPRRPPKAPERYQAHK